MTPDVIKEYNRTALLRFLAMLFATVGLVRGGTVSTLPRQLRCWVLRHLRAAEASARRLLIVEARALVVTPGPPAVRTGHAAKTAQRANHERKPGFALIERLPHTGPPPRRYAPGPGPRICFFDGSDPPFEPPAAEPSPDDAMDAGGLCHRLRALQKVLEDLPTYARRLALWDARRKAGLRRGRVTPIRPGRPPGHRRRGRHEIDEILMDCHQLALRAIHAPDTS